MATTYSHANVASTVQARAGVDETTVYSTYALTGAIVINDVFQMCKVPAGAVILDVTYGCDFLDTGTAVVTAVGDGSSAGRFISGSTIGRSSAAGVARTTEAAGLNYTYAAADTIDIKCTTAPTTSSVTGNLYLSVRYKMGQL